MRLRGPDQLAKQCQNLAPVYLISGDETLLQQESCDMIRQQCKLQGFSERQVFHPQVNADWGEILAAANSLSLFADRQLIEIRLPTGKVNETGKKALLELVQTPNPDNVILITSPKLEGASNKSTWLKAIEQQGVFLPIWPLEAKQLPNWLQQRLAQQGLSADQEALQLIADRVEGNLLAAQQEVDKLALIANDSHIGLELVLDAVADSSRYSVFNLLDYCLGGDVQHALKVLHGLKGEGNEPLSILWLLVRDIRRLHQIQSAVDMGQNIESVLQKNGVFRQQQGAFKQALRRLSKPQLTQLLSLGQVADQACKGMHKSNPWVLLEQLVLGLGASR